jgi:UDP-glucose-4-epimerase GalE
MMPVAIVTGSYGYIGSVLTKLLQESGYYVVGIDNNPDAQECWEKEKVRTKYCDELFCGDFVSSQALQILSEYPNATVFHLAANSLLGPSADFPLTYFVNNTAKTLKLLQILKPTHTLIFASTAAVYAETDNVVTEGSRIDPPNNYGLSKLWTEQMIDACYKQRSLRAASFRFFNVIGAYGDMGQLPNTPHIVNRLCDKALRKDSPFVIHGDNYDTRDGTCVRDYLHVIDVARALIHAAKYLNESKPCSLKFNLGTNVGTSVKEIVDIFSQYCTKVNTVVGDRRTGDPPFLVANPDKFKKMTAFEYKFKSVDLDLMIKSAWEYRNGL